MSEEQMAAQEANEVDTPVETTDEQPTEGDKQGEQPENQPDEDSKQLEAALQREREAREKAEKAAADLAFKNREKRRREEPEIEEPEGDDKPLTERSLKEILAREREATRKEMMSSEINRIAGQMSTSDTEKELILEVHKNRSFPSNLSLEEQLEEAWLIANKNRIKGENSELKRALLGKSGVSRDASTTHQDAPSGKQPQMAAADASEIARLGFKWSGTNRRYEKKLPNGNMLIFDPKTKQTTRVAA